MTVNTLCTVCDSKELIKKLDLGEQPPANRFVVSSFDKESETYNLSLGVCKICGTIQLTDRMPLDAVRPIYDWLLYNEPEGHLDSVASTIKNLPGISENSRFLGTTYKDESTLSRLNKLGLTNTNCIKETDLLNTSKPFGLETIQDVLQSDQIQKQLKRKYGEIDVLIVRHILEHSTSSKNLLINMSKLLKSGGYMILEIPDSEHIFKAENYAFIWEEHISYFSEDSIANIAHFAEAELVKIDRYSYPFEDSLIVVLKFDKNITRNHQNPVYFNSDIRIIDNFSKNLEKKRLYWRETLSNYKKQGSPVAIFGAGHLAVKFINFLRIADLIDCVIDDHPSKVGLKMPGSNIQILPSKQLHPRGIKVCISTLSPESEEKVRTKLPNYFTSGGVFLSASTAQ